MCLAVGDVLRDEHARHDRARSVAHGHDAVQMIAVAVRQLERRLAPFQRRTIGGFRAPSRSPADAAHGPPFRLARAQPDRPQPASGHKRVAQPPVEEQEQAVRKRLHGEPRPAVSPGRATYRENTAEHEAGRKRRHSSENEHGHASACTGEDGRDLKFSRGMTMRALGGWARGIRACRDRGKTRALLGRAVAAGEGNL